MYEAGRKYLTNSNPVRVSKLLGFVECLSGCNRISKCEVMLVFKERKCPCCNITLERYPVCGYSGENRLYLTVMTIDDLNQPKKLGKRRKII
jgi:hypothetical protein